MKMHAKYCRADSMWTFTTPEEFARILECYKSYGDSGYWNEQGAIDVYGECVEISADLLSDYETAQCALASVSRAIRAEVEKSEKYCDHCGSATCIGRFERKG